MFHAPRRLTCCAAMLPGLGRTAAETLHLLPAESMMDVSTLRGRLGKNF